MTTHKEGETTPNNKSWEEKIDEAIETTLTHEGEDYCHGCTIVETDWDAVKQFISQLLEQERKAERERVLEEAIKEVNKGFLITHYSLKSQEECDVCQQRQSIIDVLNQLKEE